MSKKAVNLSLHKSQIERQRRREVRKDMLKAVNGISNSANIVCYAIVGLSDDGRAFARWDTGGVIPIWAFPDTLGEVLRQDIADSGVPEDFKRPLIDRAWKGSK